MEEEDSNGRKNKKQKLKGNYKKIQTLVYSDHLKSGPLIKYLERKKFTQKDIILWLYMQENKKKFIILLFTFHFLDVLCIFTFVCTVFKSKRTTMMGLFSKVAINILYIIHICVCLQ